MNLTGRDFLTLKDFTPEEILYLIDLSAKLKDMKKKGIVEQPLRGKNVASKRPAREHAVHLKWQHMI